MNERYYGALQGLNKAEVAQKYGEEQVNIWRRSYDVAPPKLGLSDPRHPSNDKNIRILILQFFQLVSRLKIRLNGFFPTGKRRSNRK